MSFRNMASSSLRSKPLGELLVENGALTPAQLSQALEMQEGCDTLLGALLVRMKFCNSDAVAAALHKQIKITDIKLNRVKVDGSAARLFDRSFCEENKLLPFELVGDLICIAMANPLNRNPIIGVQKQFTRQTIKVFRTPWPEIQKAIDPVYAAVAAGDAAAAHQKHKERLRSGPATTTVAQPSPQYTGSAGTQPGFERPLTAGRQPSGAHVNRPATGGFELPPRAHFPAQGTPGASQPDLPEVSSGPSKAVTPTPAAIVIDDSWVETRQNPHIVFHQRLLNTLGKVAAPPVFLSGGLNPSVHREMLLALGWLIPEHGGLLPQSIDFTLGPEQLKMLEWRALVLRGLFCYHLSYPYCFGASPKAFNLHAPQDLAHCYQKVREHFHLFQRELGAVNECQDKLVHCNRAEIDHTLAHLERIQMLLPVENSTASEGSSDPAAESLIDPQASK